MGINTARRAPAAKAQHAVADAAEFVRFSLSQRIEHLLLIVSFTVLMATGVPQKYHEAGWAEAAIGVMGGIEAVRFVHHLAAALFVLEGIYHVLSLAYGILIKRGRLSMLPSFKDAQHAIHMLLYFVGYTKSQPKFDRFDFRQKFEYWGVVWGGVVMILTGFVMWFPLQTTQFIPGELVPAAKAAHGGEALLALLVIVTWHFYGAHFSEHTMPFDKAIFTGRVSADRMEAEHPLEYDRMITGRRTQSASAKIHQSVGQRQVARESQAEVVGKTRR